jgi:hypothetical protein
MLFDNIISHLCKRGFVTRKSWKNDQFLFIGKNNLLHVSRKNGSCEPYTLSMIDIWMDDWEEMHFFWTSSDHNFLPFKNE